MYVFRLISEQRDRQIVDRVKPFLDDGEEILLWARARHPERKGAGFAYITERRFVVVFGELDAASVPWEEIVAWGVNTELPGGPVLGIETDAAAHFVQMPVRTHRLAENVRAFLGRFTRLAPSAPSRLTVGDHLGRFERIKDPQIARENLSVVGKTRRVVVTVIGLLLLVAGIALLVLPGPGLLVIIAGLALLGSEYDWAQDAMEWAKRRSKATADRIRRRTPS